MKRRAAVLSLLPVIGACAMSAAKPGVDAAVESAQRRARSHANLAFAYLERGRPAVAAAEARLALDVDPDDGLARHALAVAQFTLGDTAAALQTFSAAAAARPLDIPLLENYARAAEQAGERTLSHQIRRRLHSLRSRSGRHSAPLRTRRSVRLCGKGGTVERCTASGDSAALDNPRGTMSGSSAARQGPAPTNGSTHRSGFDSTHNNSLMQGAQLPGQATR